MTGIATTAFASLDVIQRAVKAGLNMIVPHEVTWWNDRDDTTIVQDDAVYKRRSTSCVSTTSSCSACTITCTCSVRTSPTWARRGRSVSTARTKPRRTPHRFVVPETTLGALAADFQKRLGAKALRVVGDPNAKVRRIQLGVGYATPMISQPDVDVIVSGEQQEADGGFDSPAYVIDAMTLGIAKGWIMLGHTVSEEQGILRNGPLAQIVHPGNSGGNGASRRAVLGAALTHDLAAPEAR